jgi:PEP-CTERM motif
MIVRTLLSAAVLAVCSSLAHASAPTLTQWEFTWQGFWYSEGGGAGHDDPSALFKGTFSGIDANSNGILALTELTDFTLDNSNYVKCPPATATYQCGISTFEYSTAGGLHFNAGATRYSAEPGTVAWWTAESRDYNTELGVQDVTFGYQMPAEGRSWSATSYTTLTITQVSAVPEPSTFVMLGLGLTLLGAATLRSNRNQVIH